MNYKPLNKNVIVSRIEPKMETESGIILKSPLEPDRALILAIGSEVTEVSVGEEAILDWNKSKELEKNIYMVPVEEIVLVIE